MKKLIAFGMTAVLLCISQTGCSGDAVVKEVADQVANVVQAENENVLAVKGGEPFDYPGKTYGEAFGNFFASPTWKYFKGTQEGSDEDGDGKPDYTKEDVDVVEFTGYCTYMDTKVKALIQFVLDKENDTFEATYLSFNDIPQNNLTLWALIEKVFTDGDSVQESEVGQNQDSAEGSFTFSDLSQYSFSFSSGAGAWATGLEINADGSFTGSYGDFDMGSTGPGYPNGSAGICNFNGRFTQLKKVNEYTYSMKMEGLQYENADGSEKIENGVKYVYTGAYGVEGGNEFLVYLPGAPVSELPEEFIWWVQYDISGASELPSYALYNVAEQYGFWGYIEEGLDGEQDSSEGSFTFSDLSQYSFNYLNGMCVWNTELEINADGSFIGGYYDEGYTGEVRDYPSEDVTTNSFKGQFTQVKKVNDYTYSMKVETLTFDNVVGSKKTENGIRYTYDGARGADSGDEFLVYLQSAPASEVPLHLISNDTWRPFCFLYNVTADCWFVGYSK